MHTLVKARHSTLYPCRGRGDTGRGDTQKFLLFWPLLHFALFGVLRSEVCLHDMACVGQRVEVFWPPEGDEQEGHWLVERCAFFVESYGLEKIHL